MADESLHAKMSEFDTPDEYELKYLSRHLWKAERWDDLANLLLDVEYLDDKARPLGVSSLLEGYAEIQEGFPRDHPEWKNLDRLYRLVRQEAHVFKSWNPQELPLLLLQQMRNKAFDKRWTWLQKKTEQSLARPGVWLRLVKRLGLSGSQMTRAMGHGVAVQCVVFSPDGRWIASGGNDSLVRLWNVETDSKELELKGHRGRVTSVAFSPDGRALLSAADEGTYGSICLWDTEHGILTWTRHVTGGIICAVFSRDGEKIATGDKNGTMRLWATGHGELLYSLEHPDWVNGVAFSLDNQSMASACNDGIVRLWDAGTGLESQRLGGHEGSCKSVAFSSDGRLIAWGVSSPDCCICVWHLEAGSMLWERRIRTSSWPTFKPAPVECIAFSSDSAQIAFGTWANQVGVLDAATGRKIREWTGHDNPVLSVSFSPDGELVASGSLDESIRLWPVSSSLDRLSRKQKARIYGRVAPKALFRALSIFFSHLLETVKLLIWILSRYHPIARLWLRSLYGDATRSVAFSRDGRLAAVGLLEEGGVRIWDVRERKHILEIPRTSARVSEVALSLDGRLLVADFYDHIGVWKLDEMKEVRRIDLDGLAHHLALSPDSKLLACSTWGGEIHLWDAEQGRRLAKHQVDWGEPYVRFLRKGRVVQVIDLSLYVMLPSIWWLRVEGLNSIE